jgi:predicted enzyme related to lactoylglutathione lyase
MPIPTVGWLAYFTDPDGNIHGIYQNNPTASMP